MNTTSYPASTQSSVATKQAGHYNPRQSYYAVLVIMLFVAGCGGKTILHPDEPDTTVVQSPVDQLEDALQSAKLLEGFWVRYNPPTCDCPQLELALNNQWVRLHTDWEDQSTGSAELFTAAQAAFAKGTYPQFWLTGRLHTRAYLCGESTLCARANVYAWSTEAPPPPPAQEDAP